MENDRTVGIRSWEDVTPGDLLIHCLNSTTLNTPYLVISCKKIVTHSSGYLDTRFLLMSRKGQLIDYVGNNRQEFSLIKLNKPDHT